MKHQKVARWPTTAPKYGSLPPSSGNSCHSAPPWEIQFCSQIPWTKFCECKKLIFLFENVLDWDDSAGKEAFDNAKSRYWAEINGLQCHIPLPNPDMHIDTVSQDTFLDPRLVEDLYKLPPPPPPKEVPDYNSIEITPTGWDVEDPATARGTIPIFISAGECQSPAREHIATNSPTEDSHCGYAENLVLRRGTVDEPATIVPTGWDDEEDLCSSPACNQSAKQRKCEHIATNSPAEDSRCGYAENLVRQRGAVDEPVTIVPTGWGDEEDLRSGPACNLSAKQRNGAFYVNTWDIWYSGGREMDRKDGSFVKSRYRNSRKDGIWGNGRDYGRRISSKHTTVRHRGENNDSRGCNGRRSNCPDEDYWHDNGLSCASGGNRGR